MPRIDTKEWISSSDAAHILTVNSGHPISADYVRRLADAGRIRKTVLHDRLSLYNKLDVEGIRVRRRAENKKIAKAMNTPDNLDTLAKMATDALEDAFGEDGLRKFLAERVGEEQVASMTHKQMVDWLHLSFKEKLRKDLQTVEETGKPQGFGEEE